MQNIIIITIVIAVLAVMIKEQSDWLMEPYFPGILRLCERQPDLQGDSLWLKSLFAEYPVMLYGMMNGTEEQNVTESDYASLLMLEGTDEERKSIDEEALEYDEDALHLEQSLADALLAENGMYLENQAVQQQEAEDETQEDAAAAEFIPAQEKQYHYRWDELQSYEDVIKAFYAVDSTTKADSGLIDAETLLAEDMQIEQEDSEPQILIYHTHAQEMFADSDPGDLSTGVVGAGEYLTQILREQYGYQVMHYTVSFDAETRDYAYSNALPEIEELLRDNPSIQVVIDLHRDEMPEERRLVTQLQGRPTAQFMFFNGLCRTTQGEIAYLENPYLQDNLAFSFQMQVACNEYYPGIARRIYLKAYRYNMHVCEKTLLVELGAQNNTREEIWNACEPLAHVLDLVLSGEEPNP